MEFLRFGSSLPGSYWGCCACCIIQNFKVDPDAPASIQLVSGDGGSPVMNPSGEQLFAGPTWRDIFWQRIRFGTFSKDDMPNHAFLAILTESQINGTFGKAWLEILREAGFEFVRTVNNSVYGGRNKLGEPTAERNNNDNHIFGLFRNIGANGLKDPFTPPKAWTDLPKVKTEACEYLFDEFTVELSQSEQSELLTKQQHTEDLAIWNSHEPKPLLTEAELEAAGIPVWYAGKRSRFPQQQRQFREQAEANDALTKVSAPQVSLKAPTPNFI